MKFLPSSKALSLRYGENYILLKTLLEIRNSLTVFVIFESGHLQSLEGAVKQSFSQMLFQYNSCFAGSNLL